MKDPILEWGPPSHTTKQRRFIAAPNLPNFWKSVYRSLHLIVSLSFLHSQEAKTSFKSSTLHSLSFPKWGGFLCKFICFLDLTDNFVFPLVLNYCRWSLMMSGAKLFQLLGDLGYEGYKSLDPDSFEWPFQYDDARPILDWICSSLRSSNVLSPSEVTQYVFFVSVIKFHAMPFSFCSFFILRIHFCDCFYVLLSCCRFWDF